ncbi:universal stress protein [Corynebacterium aquilae]|uniref:Universal stress protein n=1 Tax=Corynebacterium aquilae DSM 44791 TaxID=1431546 RepID=A0A1L7CIC0_9CORY|nr:universal stress protein [Corynebacterium aquilae]APT85594.1 universal stress protein [Corynebacterium aquilae DSM 44791]
MLIAYDGSDEAKRALEYASQLLKPQQVDILTAWEPLHRQAARAASGAGMKQADWSQLSEDGDPAYDEALNTCREGVALAESLGLVARAHMVESTTAIWSAIVDAAEELKPDVIVTGTRAVTGIRSLWQSSTADNVVNHAGLPVFIVPPENDDEDE